LPNVHMREKKKIITRRRSLTRATRKTKNSQRRNLTDRLMSEEWNSSDESFESESDDLATIAIKGKASSSKSLFLNLTKHT
jgi:hypothetical protein